MKSNPGSQVAEKVANPPSHWPMPGANDLLDYWVDAWQRSILLLDVLQTIEDVCEAEARFVEEVIKRHPNAEGKPCLIGNCQAGWQIIMMSAIHPEKVGPIMLAGSPLSYWAGVHGRC
jgi:hypothetical protein